MKKALCVVFVLLISANFSVAQTNPIGVWGLHNIWGMDQYYNFNQSVSSARSMGMGGVYYAFDNQASGSFLNPAGMIYAEKSLMSLDLLVGLDKHEGAPFAVSTPFGFDDPANGYPLFSNVTNIDNKHSKFDQAGAVAPFELINRNWWFGGGFRTVLDLHSEFDMPSYIEGNQASFTEHRGIDAINFALATRALPELGLGANMNIYVRGYEQNIFIPYNYVDEFGDTLDDVYHYGDKSTFSGVNFDFGGIYDFDIAKVGVVLSTGYTLTQNALIKSANVNDYGEDVGFLDRVEMKTKFPMTYGGGIAFEPMQNFSLGFDLTLKPYSKVRIDVNPEQNLYADSAGFNPGWEDLTQLRFGAEYVFDAGFGKVPFRLGIQNIPAVYKSGDVYQHLDTLSLSQVLIVQDSIFGGDQFNTYLFSFGTGLQFEKIWFDAAYQFGSSSYDQTHYIDYVGTEYTLDRPVKYKYSRLFFSVGMLF